MNILVLGIGQSLRGDDAAGLEAVSLWQKQYPDSAAPIHVELTELPGLNLLDLLDGMDAAILVDAVHAQAAPGALLRIGPDELAAFTPETASAHGWGVAETLHLGLSLYPALAKVRITMIGIVGRQFNLGAGLSPEILAAIGEAANMIENEVQAALR